MDGPELSGDMLPLRGLDHGWGQGDPLRKPGQVPGTELSLVQREESHHQGVCLKVGLWARQSACHLARASALPPGSPCKPMGVSGSPRREKDL